VLLFLLLLLSSLLLLLLLYGNSPHFWATASSNFNFTLQQYKQVCSMRNGQLSKLQPRTQQCLQRIRTFQVSYITHSK
jgi:hypothetical protein